MIDHVNNYLYKKMMWEAEMISAARESLTMKQEEKMKQRLKSKKRASHEKN